MSRIALQLYTVRDLCADDFAGSLASTAALGFEGVELHDLYGHPVEAVRTLLDENGLVACSRHASLSASRCISENMTQSSVSRRAGSGSSVVPGRRGQRRRGTLEFVRRP